MVETIIYYFSGTGNSLDVAKHIAGQLPNSLLVSMSENPYEQRIKSSVRAGFVYPVYYGGMPAVVEQFARKIRLTDNIYIFAVATGKGQPGNAIKQMNEVFESVDYHLSYGKFIKMVDSNIIEGIKTQNTEKKIANSYVQLKDTVEAIKNLQTNQQGISNPCTSIIHQKKLKNAMKWDWHFEISDACTHCGICYHICPVGNIEMLDGKPLFLHRCEACMACIQYCPTQALNYKKVTQNKPRYHHPNIQVEDLYHR